MSLSDPTYVRTEIDANPIWQLAFSLSEIQNDAAPLGWGRYIWVAACLLANYDIRRKVPEASAGAGCVPNGLDFDRLGGTNPAPTTVPVEPPTNPKEQRP